MRRNCEGIALPWAIGVNVWIYKRICECGLCVGVGEDVGGYCLKLGTELQRDVKHLPWAIGVNIWMCKRVCECGLCVGVGMHM